MVTIFFGAKRDAMSPMSHLLFIARFLWRGVIYGTEWSHSAEYAVLDKSMGVNEMRVKMGP